MADPMFRCPRTGAAVTKIMAMATSPKSAGMSSRDSVARIENDSRAWTTAARPLHLRPARLLPTLVHPVSPVSLIPLLSGKSAQSLEGPKQAAQARAPPDAVFDADFERLHGKMQARQEPAHSPMPGRDRRVRAPGPLPEDRESCAATVLEPASGKREVGGVDCLDQAPRSSVVMRPVAPAAPGVRVAGGGVAGDERDAGQAEHVPRRRQSAAMSSTLPMNESGASETRGIPSRRCGLQSGR